MRNGLFIALMAGLTACACSSDEKAKTTPDGATGSTTVMLSGVVVEAPAFAPVAGAEVCVLDAQPTDCATTGTDGVVTVELPGNSNTGTMMTPTDAIPVLSPIRTEANDIELMGRAGWPNPAASVLIPLTIAGATGALLGLQFDSSKGYVDFNAGQLNGGKVTIVGGSSATEWYLAGGVPALAPQDGGALPAGTSLYGFANLDPGTVTFRVEKNGTPCEWDPVVWPGTEPGTVTVPIRAGVWTRLFEARCP